MMILIIIKIIIIGLTHISILPYGRNVGDGESSQVITLCQHLSGLRLGAYRKTRNWAQTRERQKTKSDSYNALHFEADRYGDIALVIGRFSYNAYTKFDVSQPTSS